MGTVLIVDDVEDLRYSLSNTVRRAGYSVSVAANGQEALEILRTSIVELIFLDIGLPDGNGINLIPKINELSPGVDIIMLSGRNDAKSAVQSLREGAVDYIVKPFDLIEFKSVLHRIMRSRLLGKQAQLADTCTSVDAIIGNCESMRKVKETIHMASEVESPVLITGETGTGKELVARAIHDACPGNKGVFVKVDCGTLSANLVESELFGHDRGAFTDALTDKKGLVEVASDGTLFLDEIGNLPIALQPKLLRLIEESIFRKVGGIKDIAVKVRIIAATNADIDREIDAGTFREDLYYRLNVIPLQLPPLRDRGDDVLLLADAFIRTLSRDLKKEIRGIAPSAVEAMLAYDWPGNIRELRNLIEREIIFCKSGWLNPSGLRPAPSCGGLQGEELVTLRENERRYIKQVLNYTNNNKSKAARILDISRTTLREKLD
ncbi:sigma-54-dependent transcriptional regulator [Desulfopila aestuarii]|uniref:DNA-binding transcriptional response regulator, NtrC family, contains REC, AAA-type ATPase, and a Fis-type DNA-binding domains n=1 Tax=Desulfopila aestuarii DSM 18488 TaxID=1121416 RepID=A0A1M7Y346_9BACT|nr:sigma-54 dependent transcriptional regulator [Desulfopila aestuarii]SHO46507.1 DNA-binding transcriptional response regulator, NtrC family, contains REC, AAA-type ATPase, and a Fis-type DNA-binding domains [Desulfopila aestuarii DSM 18488]